MRKVSRRLALIALFVWTGVARTSGAEAASEVTLHLKNGDRLTGQVLSEDDERVVLSTPWNVAIFVPKTEIERQVVVRPASESEGSDRGASELATTQPGSGEASQSAVPKQKEAAEQKAPKAVQTPSVSSRATAPKRPKRWKWNLKLGTDFVSGARDREIYFGQTTLTYTRNYERNPKKFLRNTLQYRVDYGKTDGTESVNRMLAANKLDADIGSGFYGYGAFGGGYDKVRKIKYQCELGPGLGYHLIAEKTLAMDGELGLNYQYREGLNGAPNREVLQSRIGQELTWEVMPKITLTEQVGFLPFLDDFGEYQIRFEGNLGFGIVRHLSLNLTVLNLYDTLPAPGVPNNEFQFRSSLGVNF